MMDDFHTYDITFNMIAMPLKIEDRKRGLDRDSNYSKLKSFKYCYVC